MPNMKTLHFKIVSISYIDTYGYELRDLDRYYTILTKIVEQAKVTEGVKGVYCPSLSAESFFRRVMIGTNNNRTAMIKEPGENGRETKMEKSPRDNIKDCRRDASSSPPSTRARTKGGAS